MKKLVLSLAILGFITFGALSVQNIIAATSNIEMVNFDKDPKKEDTKKAADTKEVKSETKDVKASSKSCSSSCASSCSSSCASSCTDKSATAKECCSKDKASCTPDKK